MNKKYKSEALMVMHQDAKALYRIGAMSAERLQEFDEMCLVRESEIVSSTGAASKQSTAPVYAYSNN